MFNNKEITLYYSVTIGMRTSREKARKSDEA